MSFKTRQHFLEVDIVLIILNELVPNFRKFMSSYQKLWKNKPPSAKHGMCKNFDRGELHNFRTFKEKIVFWKHFERLVFE